MIIGFALLVCLFCLQLSTKKASAATTEITPMTISRPGEIDENKDADIGIAYKKEASIGETIYTISVPERGWLVIDIYGGWVNRGAHHLYKNSSFTSEVYRNNGADQNSGFATMNGDVRRGYYVEKGTYYYRDKLTDGEEIVYIYFLPDSAAISHNLVKKKDNSGYTDSITFTPHLGTTYLVSGIVSTADVNDSSFWNKSITNADDVYSITDNGEYTVKAVFTDTEWKDYPVMYSFSVYDIGKATKDDKGKDDDAKSGEVKLNYTSKTIKVGESFKLKVTGAKVVSFKSSKKSVAKVTASGKVVGKKKGTATIKVTCDNGETYFCKVKVVKK